MDRLVPREELQLQELKFAKEIDDLRKENADLHNALIEAKRQQDKDHIKVPIEQYCVGCEKIRLKTIAVRTIDTYGNETIELSHQCKHADFCQMIAEQAVEAAIREGEI